MRKVLLLARRELRAALSRPLAYMVMAAFLALAGLVFNSLLLAFVRFYPQAAGGPFGDAGFTVDEQVIRPLVGQLGILLVMLAPALAMGLMADERRQGSADMLLSVPIRGGEIILGKWLGAWLLTLLMLAGTVPLLVTVAQRAAVDWPAAAVGYAGLALLSGVVLAGGLWASTLTDSQAAAYAGGLGLALALWLAEWLAGLGVAPGVLSALSLQSALEEMARGVLGSPAVVRLAALTAGFLVLARQTLAVRRWL
jgi:ABC-2 type transport system permease protein